jgi:methyl-accepting chemotaxis protein
MQRLLGLSPRIQFTIFVLSLVGIAFGVKGYWHVRDVFGASASTPFVNDIWVQLSIAVPMQIVAGLLIFYTVTKPIARLTEAMRAVAGGALETEVPYQEKRDEIGAMAQTVQVFKENSLRMKEMEKEQEEMRLQSEKERQEMLEQFASEFDFTVRNISDVVVTTSSSIKEASKGLVGSSENNNEKMSHLKEVFSQAANNINTVSTAADELSSSIGEISVQATRSSEMAQEAKADAEKANTTIQGLSAAAERISEVIGLINELAEQINLLALNATIEAARAGDAGKGFDVVASEVKNLSTQTEAATDEISKNINAIQSETKNAVKFIEVLSQRIEEITGVATNISSAVEQQNASTRDIAMNIQSAAENTKQVQLDVDGVSTATQESGESAQNMLSASTTLSEQSEKLNTEVAKFINKMRTSEHEKTLAKEKDAAEVVDLQEKLKEASEASGGAAAPKADAAAEKTSAA